MKKSKSKNKEKEEVLILPEIHNDRSYIGYTSGDNFSFGEEREFKINPVASKFAFDLFKEEDAAIQAKVVRVKHTRGQNKTEKWKVYEDNRNTFTLDSTKISKREIAFLHSVEGVQFLLSQAKKGNLNTSNLKKEMKIKIDHLSRKR